MKLTQTKIFKFLVCPALFLFTFVLLDFSYRFTAVVLLIPLVLSYFYFLRSSRTTWMRLIFVSFLVAVFLPIDVSMHNVPGPPRFVPLIMGLAIVEEAAIRNGDVMLGGCMVRGNEPRWVLVW